MITQLTMTCHFVETRLHKGKIYGKLFKIVAIRLMRFNIDSIIRCQWENFTL